ncbi:MAG: hypothetical protein M3446_08480 [Actinomycetota bacterium]|nr:hypothetical protein [Actinomycetota bacterium]
MHRLTYALLPAGLLLAVGAEWESLRAGKFSLAVVDALVGLVLITCGVVAWQRRPASRSGLLMVLTGFTWFAGNLVPGTVFLHRGPLTHLLLCYPSGRPRHPLTTTTVLIAYVVALAGPITGNDVLTLVMAALIAVTAADVFRRTSGPARRAGEPALMAGLAYAAVLAGGSVQRLAGWGADGAVLYAYDAVVLAVVVLLFGNLIFGRWTEATVADLVVGLGEREGTSLRDQLARALGEPSLVVGYWIAEQGGYVDDAGRHVELPAKAGERVVTAITHRGERVAVLIHDALAIDDPRLVDGVASVTRLAVANARLQAEVRARVDELTASRRRIVEAGDAQGRELARELAEGPERRLDVVAGLLDDASGQLTGPERDGLTNVQHELRNARAELRNFAQGIRPLSLSEGGLAVAVPLLTERVPIPVSLSVKVGRLPPAVEAAAYFVCSEALTNVAKHAAATSASIVIGLRSAEVVVEISDDGVGGADTSRGSGLRGLSDRVEALGGELTVQRPEVGGTKVTAVIPTQPGRPD